MTHSYQLTGMTCSSCESKVKNSLLLLPEVVGVEVSKEQLSATITMNHPIALADLQQALGGDNSKYKISNQIINQSEALSEVTDSWFKTYKPIVLIFLYITGVSIFASFEKGTFQSMTFMRIFMGGFFLVFSFFKMLNLKGFAESYAMYDLVAKKIPSWGYVYAFLELGLGIGFVLNVAPVLMNWITLIVMLVSILGVLESVLNKKKIKCACLGSVFNLPMSTVTIVEDGLMIAMSALMIILM